VHRRSIARVYAEELDAQLVLRGISSTIDTSANLRFPILVNDRERLIEHLRRHGIHVSDIWYDAPIAPKKHIGKTTYRWGTCPQAEKLSDMMVNLPTHINVSSEAARKIAAEVNKFFNHAR